MLDDLKDKFKAKAAAYWAGDGDSDATCAAGTADQTCATPAAPAAPPLSECTCDTGTCVFGAGVNIWHGFDCGCKLYDCGHGEAAIGDTVPERLKGLTYATHTAYPNNGDWNKGDTRTDQTISHVRCADGPRLLAAVTDPNATGDGWKRTFSGDTPDFSVTNAELGYYLYEHGSEDGAQWVELPKAATGAGPPFVFSETGKLTFANPLPLPNGVVIYTAGFIANPTLCKLPNGDFLAGASGKSVWAPPGRPGAKRKTDWKIYRSGDGGKTWQGWSCFQTNLNRQTLFEHNGSVYYMGAMKHPEDGSHGIIYRSTDDGKTFDSSTPLWFDAGDAPANVVVTQGRIWKAVTSHRDPTFASAPIDADLMDADSWTIADRSKCPGVKRDVEGVTVLCRDGRVINAAPGKLPDDFRGAGFVYSDGPSRTTHECTEGVGYGHLPQHGKFSIVYDGESDMYWALSNTFKGQPRNVLGLFSSRDLGNWKLEKEVLRGPSSRFHGFQYPDITIDGEDMVFVSRTAWEDSRGLSSRWHDGNMLTFHWIRNFRGGEGVCSVAP